MSHEENQVAFESEAGVRYVRDRSGKMVRVREERPGEHSSPSSASTAAAVAGTAVAAIGLAVSAPVVLLAGGIVVLGSLFRRRK